MAEMVCSALFQETVSRGVSFALGKREEKASQGHLKERLQLAVSELEFVLERAQELPIRHLSLLGRRKQFKSVYMEAVELLDKHKQQQVVPAAGAQLQVAQGPKRKRWITTSFARLSTDDVRKFELYADHAGRFLRDLESGCSLHHYTFCNPIVRHLLEGKTLLYRSEQGNKVRRGFFIWPTYSDERGVEAVLVCGYLDSTMTEKSFIIVLTLRLSESTDIVGVAIKCLHLLASEFKLMAECAMRELSRLSNSQDIIHSYGLPWVGFQWENFCAQLCRPDPACCKGSRDGLCANNNVSSELSNIIPEQVICWTLLCYVPAALVPSRGASKPPVLQMTASFVPHVSTDETQGSYAIEAIGDQREYRDASIQKVVQTIKSDAINCFVRQPEQTKYEIGWVSRHGIAWFWVEKESMERTGGPKTRRYNTRGSTRRSRRR